MNVNPDDFTDSGYYTGPELTDGMVDAAEAELGHKLPSRYLDLLRVRNGGVPTRRRFDTGFPTSWEDDHFEVKAILGIGGNLGVVNPEGTGSAYMVKEWDYPNVGVVLCATPSGGHDTVMLDYRDCGPQGEPAVVYVDEDREPKRIADSFEDFWTRLRPTDA